MSTQPSNIPVLPAPTDFTAADMDMCVIVLQDAISQAFPKWTDFNRAAPGNVLLRGMCFVLDILTKYQNDQARETLLSTVQRRRNMIAIARGFGVRLRGQSAATVDLTFTITGAPLAYDVVIPAGTQVDTVGLDSVLKFFTIADIRIAAGGSTGVASAINAESKSDSFTSSGAPDQVFRLASSPVVEDTISVVIGTDSWVQVENFFNSAAASKHFAVVVDEFERATVIFGNGVSGQVPQTSDSILVTYRTGGGSGGNVAATTVSQLNGVIRDTANNTVGVTVSNVLVAGGGADRESVERARRRIPGAIRALTRTVSKEDFEVVALGVPGVARSLMLTSNEDSGIAENTGEIIVIPEGDPVTLPSTALKAQVVQEVTVVFPTLITFAVVAVDPVLLPVAVTADIRVANGYTLAQATTNIETDLKAFFATQDANGAPNSNVDFGANQTDALIAWSDIFKVVASATGVQRVEEDTFVPADDVAIDYREFPTLGTVTVGEI